MSEVESAQPVGPQEQDKSIDSEPIQLRQIPNGELEYEDLGERNCIGEGTFGRVLPGTLNGEDVAVKVIKIPFMLEEVYKSSCEQEIKVMMTVNKLCHANIVQFKGYKIVKKRFLIVSELVRGKNLEEILNEAEDEERVYLLEFKNKLTMMLELAQALQGLHKINVTHRDVKPTNLLITK